MSPKSRSLFAALGAVIVALACAAGAALAGGGGSIASAPKMSFGSQTFDNTDAAPVIGGCDKNVWWSVPLIAGDSLVINFEDSSPGVGTDDVEIYAPSVTDFNLDNSNSVASAGMNDNNHGQVKFAAPSTGSYPLTFHADNCNQQNPRTNDAAPGAFDFTALVYHRAKLVMNLPGSIPARGSITLQAHYPDGSAIPTGLGATLYGFWNKTWTKLGQAAVSGGKIVIKYSLPSYLKGTELKLQAKAGGGGFQAAKVSAVTGVER